MQTKKSDEMKWVTVITTIKEAAFTFPQWAHLKYPAKWLKGEKRNLPKSLRDKLTRQGIALVEPEPDARESFIPAQPVLWNGVIDVDAIRRQYEDEQRIQVVMKGHGLRHGWKHGSFKTHFEDILNYPLEWMRDEIREIPYSLFIQLVDKETPISAHPTDINKALENEKAQAIHGYRLAEWRKERAAKQEQAQAKQKAYELAQAVKEEEQHAKAKAAADLVERAKTRIGA